MDTPRTGRPRLSDRRRTQTRLAVAYAALDLFVSRGVPATSVTQIAAAAGISTRTFWRYFNTKESSVRPLLLAITAVAVRALRTRAADGELLDVFADVPSEHVLPEPAVVLSLLRLTQTDVGLRAEWLAIHYDVERMLAAFLAGRGGRSARDLTTRVQAAAIAGVLRVAAEHYAEHHSADALLSIEGLQAAARRALEAGHLLDNRHD